MPQSSLVWVRGFCKVEERVQKKTAPKVMIKAGNYLHLSGERQMDARYELGL